MKIALCLHGYFVNSGGTQASTDGANYIKNNIIKDFNISSNYKPLKGISILDIGCGGGLLSEPLARLGAEVVGIDASKKNIDIAKHHLKKSNLSIEYQNVSPENFSYKKKFDKIFPDLAKKFKIVFIPFLLEGVAMKPEFNLSDGIHPNEKGTIIMSRTLEETIIKTYNKKN